MKQDNVNIYKGIIFSILFLSVTVIISSGIAEASDPLEIGGNIDGTIPTTTETPPPTNTEIGGNIDGTLPTVKTLQKKVLGQKLNLSVIKIFKLPVQIKSYISIGIMANVQEKRTIH